MRLFFVLALAAFAQSTAESDFSAGEALYVKNDFQGALEKWESAQKAFHQQGLKAREFETDMWIGRLLYRVDESKKSKSAFEDALKLATALKDRKKEAEAHEGLGRVTGDLEEYAEMTAHYEAALKRQHQLKDTASEVQSLFWLCQSWFDRDQPRKALGFCQRSLAQFEALRKRKEELPIFESRIHFLMGNCWQFLNDYEHSLAEYAIVESLDRKDNDKFGLATALTASSTVLQRTLRFREALETQREALSLYRELGNKANEAVGLAFISDVYLDLGEYEMGLEAARKALAFVRLEKYPVREAALLRTLGTALAKLGRTAEAVAAFEENLPICLQLKSERCQALTYLNLGQMYANPAKARDANEKAMAFATKIGEDRLLARALTSFATSQWRAGNLNQAISLANAALARLSTLRGTREEAALLSNLMEMWNAKGSGRVAILYGKLAVNLYQQVRTHTRDLEPSMQLSYIRSIEGTYRKLADLMIEQGRLNEARAVVGLLKEQEYQDFARRSLRADGSKVDLTPEEAGWYQKVQQNLFETDRRRRTLEAKDDPKDQQELKRIYEALDASTDQFQNYIQSLATAKVAPERAKEVRESTRLLQALREDMPAGTVVIYTLVGEDKFRTVLITPGVQKSYEYPIRAADFNNIVFGFGEALRDSRSDPRPLAKRLYDIVIGEKLAQDLVDAQASTIMWSLDGVLRYVPMAALYDGGQYLVEKYRLSTFTPGRETMTKKPSAGWNVAAFGVTKKHGDFDALPAVEAELRGLVREGETGVLPGKVMLDEQFTPTAMRAAQSNRYKVIHIASHFNFNPGDDSKSFLLLGDGSNLTLADVRKQPVAEGVELLALSACNTGVGGGISTGDGREVEGFGMLAQEKISRSVLATLWEVADASTSILMREFYRVRESEAGMSKAEALRRAQLALMTGKGTAALVTRGVRSQGFAADPGKPFAHPYFWAPFFLMGNWL